MNRSAAAIGAALMTAAAGIGLAAPAHADAGDISASVVRADESEIHVSVCLTAVDALPATLEFGYSVSSDGGTLASGRLGDDDPSAVTLLARPCPRPFTSFALEGLTPATTYTIDVTVTMTPRVTGAPDDPADVIPVDTARPVRTDAVRLVVSTVGSPAVPVTATDPDPEPGGGPGSPGQTPATASDPIGGTTPAEEPPAAASSADEVIVVAPQELNAAALATLSPTGIASIPPASFGLLSASELRVLTPGQAARITPAQAATIRPLNAAGIRPVSVAAMTPSAVRALRPAAVRAMAPAVVGRMTKVQLRALTARQAAALRPRQLAVLTPVERALLRRPAAAQRVQ